MFDISWSELLVILAVAVFVTRPEDIPKLLYAAGRMFRRLQSARLAVRGRLDAFLRENGLEDIGAVGGGLEPGGMKSLAVTRRDANETDDTGEDRMLGEAKDRDEPSDK